MICEIHARAGGVRIRMPTGEREKGKSPMPRADQARIRWNMVFTWQAPIMLLSYAVISFLMGITVYITTPLYSDDTLLGGKPVSVYAETVIVEC
jgi:hypothetical protein